MLGDVAHEGGHADRTAGRRVEDAQAQAVRCLHLGAQPGHELLGPAERTTRHVPPDDRLRGRTPQPGRSPSSAGCPLETAKSASTSRSRSSGASRASDPASVTRRHLERKNGSSCQHLVVQPRAPCRLCHALVVPAPHTRDVTPRCSARALTCLQRRTILPGRAREHPGPLGTRGPRGTGADQ